MTNQLTAFNFENHQVRTTVKDNGLWFIAQDVCLALRLGNVSESLKKLDNDEKATISLNDSRAGNGAQKISIISESGMYTLVLRCRNAVKPGTTPHRFRKWVTNEVLPQIRKTGGYQIQKENIDSQKRRYRFDVTITDNLFHGEQITFSGIANTFNAAISGIANNLGYKITGLNNFDEGLKKLL